MFYTYILLVLATASISYCQPSKCDQTPPGAVYKEPRDDKHPFRLNIENNSEKPDDNVNYFTADQTYVLSLATTTTNRTFRWFMITAEDPDVDNTVNNRQQAKDVGSLKTLDILQSRHSERCANSVENFDNTDKFKVEVHWVSPHETDRVRIRAMVAENDEVWYEGENLNITLVKEESPARDSSPNPPVRDCSICGEARYEVIFKGLWSRVAHPQHYPTKPDENGYTHMVGASHDFDYYLWKAGSKAREGLKVLLETASTHELEREIISEMSETSGTRTLIRGKRRHHPYMFEDSHSLFRVDRIHHLFSVVVGMRPSPDWFLGMTQFELCVNGEWLKEHEVSLYPWDAGTRSGVSYESETAPTQDNIERVEVGSFNMESPFYQKNLNDLKPFAKLLVRRLDVYPWDESECAGSDNEQDNADEEEEEEPSDEPQPYPMLSESRQKLDSRMSRCYLGEWGEWSACVPDVGDHGIGARTRTRQRLTARPTDVYSAPEVYYPDGNHATNLMNHLQLKHRIQYNEINLINIDVTQGQSQTKEKKTDQINKTIDKVTECCIKLVAIHGRPFELLGDDAFREILSMISPNIVEVANIKKIKALILEKANTMKNKIAAEVDKKLISIKMDSATCMDRQFIGINAQYVKDSKIVVRNLAIFEIFVRQTSENLKLKLLEVLADYRIPISNIYSITTDNGANYLKISKLLNEENNIESVLLVEDSDSEQEDGIENEIENIESMDASLLNESIERPRSFEIRSLPCAAHTLQLCVKDALKKDRESESVIESCRRAVKVLRRPLMRTTIIKENKRQPLLDCPTRWTSTYYMLKRLEELKTICDGYSEITDILTEVSWVQIHDILLSLEPSKEATIRLQGEQITIGDFYSIWIICKNKTDEYNMQLAKEIVAAMTEREKTLLASKAFLPAIFMDPRLKLILSEQEEETGKRWLKDVYYQMEKLRKSVPIPTPEYHSSPDAPSCSFSSPPTREGQDRPRTTYLDDLQSLEIILNETQRTHLSGVATLDLDHYLIEYRMAPRLAPLTEKPLEFWASKRPNNPLADLAFVVLGAPATQVTVERLFSTLKFILSPLRNRLLDQNLKSIVFIKSNQDLF